LKLEYRAKNNIYKQIKINQLYIYIITTFVIQNSSFKINELVS